MLEDYGFNATRMIGGFWGAVVYVFYDKQTKVVAIIGSLVTGVMMANFLGESAGKYLSWVAGEHGSDFIVGLGGTLLVPMIIATIKKWKPGENE